MGNIKNYNIKNEKKRRIITILIFFIVFGILVWGLNIMDKHLAVNYSKQKELNYINAPDTLIISRDLGSNGNIKAFIKEHYPSYRMISYKHVASDYSAWNGAHNFYEFILVKK